MRFFAFSLVCLRSHHIASMLCMCLGFNSENVKVLHKKLCLLHFYYYYNILEITFSVKSLVNLPINSFMFGSSSCIVISNHHHFRHCVYQKFLNIHWNFRCLSFLIPYVFHAFILIVLYKVSRYRNASIIT